MTAPFVSRISLATLAIVTASMLGVAGLPASSAAAGAPATVYVVNYQANGVSQYAIGAAGQLAPLDPAMVASGSQPNFVALSVDGRSAYVTNNGDNTVSQYDVDAMSGALTPKDPATVATGSFPSYVAVSVDGRSAYIGEGGTGPDTIAQYDIDPTSGALTAKDPPTVSAPDGVIALAPDGSSLYATDNLHGEIFQYDIDPTTGALTPKDPASVPSSFCTRICTTGAPAGMAVTPDGRSAYVTDNLGSFITQYNIDPFTGELSSKFPAPVRTGDPPEHVATGNAPDGISLSSDGQHAYVADRDDNTISQYDIDPTTGALSPMNPATVASDPSPEYMAVSADGTSLYATNGNSAEHAISQYDIDPTSGALSPKVPPTVTTDAWPVGIAVLAPKNPTTASATCTPNTVVASEQTTCTVTVSDASNSPTTPSGTVSFVSDSDGTFSGGNACTLSGGGTATSCQVDYTPSTVGSGTHTVQASYVGDAQHGGTRARTTVTVNDRATTTTVSCSPNPMTATIGGWCTMTITDTDPAGIPSMPTTGDVGGSFSSDGSGTFPNGNTCAIEPGSGVSATCTQDYIPSIVGPFTMTGRFDGDAAHAPSSGTTTVPVVGRPTDTSLSCSPASVAVGQTTSCTATVNDGAADGAPQNVSTGTVSFTTDSNGTFSAGTCTLTGSTNPTSCQVTYTPTAYGSGTHTLSAAYGGDSTHAPSSVHSSLTLTNPAITSVSPTNGATGVNRTSSIVAIFNKAMDKPPTQGAFSLHRTSDGTTVNGNFAWYGNGLIFTPTSPLANNTTYTAAVTTAAQDVAGDPLATPATWTFTTATQPLITAIAPADAATGVYPNTSVIAVFDTAMNKPSAQSAFSLKRTSNGAAITGTFTWSGNALIFKPNIDLASGTQYTASVSTGAKDLAGHALPATKTWRFTTTTSPIIDSVKPANGTTGVPRTTVVVAVFNKAMNKTTAQNAFSLKRTSNGAVVNGTFSWSGNTLTFTPSSTLVGGAQYTATETSAAKDTNGNPILNPQTWKFTTRTT